MVIANGLELKSLKLASLELMELNLEIELQTVKLLIKQLSKSGLWFVRKSGKVMKVV